MTASLDICYFLPLLFVGYFPLCDVIRLSWALFRVINKLTRHLGQKCRGDHSPRTQTHSLLTCCTSPRMVISPVHWLVFLGCSYLLIQDIGPGLSLYTVGAQGKIGPHNSPSKSCFSASREKRRILILSSDLPYDLILLSQIIAACVFLFATRS